MRVTILMGNRDLYVMWEILEILQILIRTLYLMLSPFMLVKILLMTKVMNLLCKRGISQIVINTLQCIFTLQNTTSKR